jgi:hypothetical protein
MHELGIEARNTMSRSGARVTGSAARHITLAGAEPGR